MGDREGVPATVAIPKQGHGITQGVFCFLAHPLTFFTASPYSNLVVGCHLSFTDVGWVLLCTKSLGLGLAAWLPIGSL